MSVFTESQELTVKYRELFNELERVKLYSEVLRAEMTVILKMVAIPERDIFFATYPEAKEKDFLKALHEAMTDFTVPPPKS